MDTTLSLQAPIARAKEDNLAFLAFPARHAAEQVTGTENELFTAIQTILHQTLADVCTKSTAEEFCASRNEAFPKYVQIMTSLAGLVSAVVPGNVINRLTYESFSEMEANFRSEGAGAFGQYVKDQAMFTVWTLRKINDLAKGGRLRCPPRKSLIPADRELAENFVGCVLYSRFHLDCLQMSLHTEKALYPEVLESISDGLRTLVNAYAYIRQASDLRSSLNEEEPIHIDFDEEEQELLSLSMRDVGSTLNA
jgi:hypothetical protein